MHRLSVPQLILFSPLLTGFTLAAVLTQDPLQLQELLALEDAQGRGCGSDAVALLGMKASVSKYHAVENQQESSDRRFFVWLSDAHVDPHYGLRSAACTSHGNSSSHPSMGKLGCDPSLALWVSSVEAAARFGHAADFVLTTGDHARHQPDALEDPSNNVTSILLETAHVLNKTFSWLGPERFVTGAHGNDDSPTDYGLNITTDAQNNPWLSVVAASWRQSGVMTQPQEQAFSYGGFFETEVGGLRILSINTIIYSVQHVPAKPEPEDPFGQFAWLRERLGRAAREGRRVWIIGHIPPGHETYSYTPLWRSEYVKSYLSIMQDPVLGNTIAAQLFGHVHADEFRVIPGAPRDAGPVLLTGALSPIYDCNPSFRLVEYNATSGRLLNVRVFWSPLPQGDEGLSWRPAYSFLEAYQSLKDAEALEPEPGLTNRVLMRFTVSLWKSWMAGGQEFRTYASWYKTQVGNDLQFCVVGHGSLALSTKRRFMAKYFCGLNITTYEAFNHCARKYSLRPPSAGYPGEYAPLWDYQKGRELHWRTVATDEEQSILEEALQAVHIQMKP